MTTATLQDRVPQNLLENHIEPFLDHLRSAGYAERTRRKKRSVVRAFARWTKRKRITADDIDDGHVAAFVARSPRRRKAHVKFEVAVLRLLFQYLRSGAGLQGPPMQEDVSAGDGLLRRYEDYLRKARGLAENSVHVYVPFIRDLLTSQATQSGCVSAGVI